MKGATFLNWSKAFFKKRNLCLVIYRSHFVNHQPRGTANLLPSLKRDANKVLIDAVLACLEFPPWSFFGGKTQMEADWGLTVLWPHFTQNFIIFSRGRAGGEIYRVIRIHYSAIADTKTKVGTQKLGEGAKLWTEQQTDEAYLCTLREVILFIVLEKDTGLQTAKNIVFSNVTVILVDSVSWKWNAKQ